MGEKIVVGPINKGVKTDRTPFVIDNDSFPVLLNSYQWRGRVKRKRGTSLLNRLKRFFNSSSISYSGTSTITLDGSGNGNILTGFSLQTNGNIVPGSVTLVGSTGPVTYTDPTMDGYLTPTGTSGPNTINYATGAIHIPAQAGATVTAQFNYYPDLPVMGLEDLILNGNIFGLDGALVTSVDSTQFPGNIGFDTTYAYQILPSAPYNIYDVSFYKNPATSTYPSYVAKTNWTPTSWNGLDYQQFWTTNYQGALWTTNGITVPFTSTNVGMQYKKIVAVTVTSSGPPAIVNLQITAHGLVVGDFLFINEVVTTTGINYQTGYVTVVVDANNVTVEFPNATITTAGTGGIAQYLTNRVDTTVDGLRWYDGDPTNGNATLPTLNQPKGWANFAPPLNQAPFSISEEPAAIYYLVGARMIVPFKDRLLFIGPVIQTSSGNDTTVNTSQVYLQDTVIYSQNGTAFYTCSYTNTPSATVDTPTNPTNVYTPILVPTNQTATPSAYFEDSAGFGGYIQAGVDQPILTASPNEDVLIMGFSKLQSRFVYTGNDLVPFNFFIINSELGSGSTFSIVNLDRGPITVGQQGIIAVSQTEAARIDLDIPDQVFQFNLTSNGAQRVCSQRDYINEWMYFSYCDSEVSYNYPNQTLQYNYRDNSWGIFNECYTTYGTMRKASGYTWATIGQKYPTWGVWNAPWNAGASTLLQPQVIAGNQQGFVMVRETGSTDEGNSLYIRSFSGNTVTAPNHCLNSGDYIVISGCLGTIGSIVNGNIYSVDGTTQNTFTLNPPISSGTYFGGGVIKRMYVPFIQTKQFPVSWAMARKTRIGPQMYLLSTTSLGQIELQIYLSQNAEFPYNFGPIVPQVNSDNNSLIYTDVLYTCPESTNLGLTPANTNLQMVTAPAQAQIWHRMNTSLLGDTVQLGFTINDAQMRDTGFNNQFAEVELHGMIIDTNPSQLLC